MNKDPSLQFRHRQGAVSGVEKGVISQLVLSPGVPLIDVKPASVEPSATVLLSTGRSPRSGTGFNKPCVKLKVCSRAVKFLAVNCMANKRKSSQLVHRSCPEVWQDLLDAAHALKHTLEADLLPDHPQFTVRKNNPQVLRVDVVVPVLVAIFWPKITRRIHYAVLAIPLVFYAYTKCTQMLWGDSTRDPSRTSQYIPLRLTAIHNLAAIQQTPHTKNTLEVAYE
ncbi:hypothetical protein BC835DRAFT_1311791, partial [Cytidiella melzeri]